MTFPSLERWFFFGLRVSTETLAALDLVPYYVRPHLCYAVNAVHSEGMLDDAVLSRQGVATAAPCGRHEDGLGLAATAEA